MPSDALSHRERVRLALEHRATDRVPIAMVCSGVNAPAHRAWEAYLARERGMSAAQYLAPLIDIKGIAAPYIGPTLPADTDTWGVHRSLVSYGPDAYYEIDRYPLRDAQTVDDVITHTWPSSDWYDYSALPTAVAQLQADGECCLMVSGANPFESTWYMRGFEQTFMDLATAPELIHAILEQVTSFFVAHLSRVLEAVPGAIDLVFTADDIAGQNGLLMSLGMWDEHLRPYHERVNRVIHEHGAKVIYHSDGGVAEAVPGLIEAGIDVLQALQFDAARMDPTDLKQRFGNVLCFQGGVSVQHTLPFGTPTDVVVEVQHLIDTLGRDGGYILGPSHAIQAGTPPENITAMFDTAATYYPQRRR